MQSKALLLFDCLSFLYSYIQSIQKNSPHNYIVYVLSDTYVVYSFELHGQLTN